MNAIVEPISKSPSECTDAELTEFIKLVLSGGAVEKERLDERVRLAFRLTFLWGKAEGVRLVGTAALKRPSPFRRRQIPSSASIASTELSEAAYPYELGWVCIHPDFQGKKYSFKVTQAALEGVGESGIFATTRKDTCQMQRTLERLGFSACGSPYASGRGTYKLGLFVRTRANYSSGNLKAYTGDSAESKFVGFPTDSKSV